MKYEVDDKYKNFIFLSYEEIMTKFKNKDTFVFYFGGSWCKNCRAVDYMIINVTKENNLFVYCFDPRKDGIESKDDFRKCNNEKQEKLYKEFVSALKYKNENTILVVDDFGNERDTKIPSVPVPAVFAMKNGVINYVLIEEYEEDGITNEIELYYENELKQLINKL